MKSSLTQGKVNTQLLHLTLPMVWGVFAVIGFNLVDTYFVGQLGTQELAAISFTFPVVMILGSVSMGLGIGASSVIARAIGEGDRHQVKQLTTHSLSLSLLVVVIFALVGLSTIDPLFSRLGANEQILPLIHEYMTPWYWGMMFLVVPMVGNSAIRAAGNTLIPSLTMTVAAVANGVLDPLFIFGIGNFDGLGLRGAAIATVLARAITLVVSIWFLHFRLNLLLWERPQWPNLLACWRNILAIGLPATATNMISPFSAAIITQLMASYGAEAVAGFGVASRLEAFALLGLLGLSASIGPFVGQNWGAKLYQRVRQSINISFRWSLAWGLSVALILALIAPSVVVLFNQNADVIAIASQYLRIVPVSYSASGIIFVSAATFNALGKPFPSMIINFTRMVLLYVPLAYLGSWIWGIQGIFGATLVANLAVGLGSYWWIRHDIMGTITAKVSHLKSEAT